MRALLITTAILVFSLNVFAEDNKAAQSQPTVVKGKDTVVYEKNTEMSFDGRSLDGDIVNPNGAAVEADKNLYFDSMFEGREDFKKELKRSSGAI